MTQAAISSTSRWRCERCHTIFNGDETSTCPHCHNDDGGTITLMPAEQAQTRPAPQPAKSPPAPASARPRPATGPIIGLFAVLFGIPAWLEGARTTRDGWIFGLNWIAERAGLPVRIPAAATWLWWVAALAMVALGWAYSRVELHWTPVRLPRDIRKDFFTPDAWYVNRVPAVWLIWVLVLFTDVVTMFLGARQATSDDPVFLQQIAASVTSAWIYAILITFIPDRLIRLGWRSIRR